MLGGKRTSSLHSCETALLRVYNDIVITIGKSNGSFLVLLDLSAAFDTIDHDNLFMILERFVGISGSALQLIKSYFSGRTQRVVIDGILSDFANLVCGVPQGSVLGPMKFCLYLLLLFPLLVRHVQPVFFERSFIYAAPTLWNQLSIDIRMLEFNQFKSRVKTELYLKYFEP